VEHETDMAPGLDPSSARVIRERITTRMILNNWVDDPRIPPQSNSAQAFVNEVFDRYPNIEWDDQWMIPDLAAIILEHNWDPHDTDLVGTILDLLKYIRERVL